MNIPEKIKHHQEHKNCIQIIRQLNKGGTESCEGYVLASSETLVLIHEIYDFTVMGYLILPITTINKIPFSSSDKYVNKIMQWENIVSKIGIHYPINLESWPSLFKSLKKQELHVIVECEHPDIDSFNIGPVTKVGNKYVRINHFDGQGYFEDTDTRIDYPDITKVQFDDPYSKVFSKYTRHKKA